MTDAAITTDRTTGAKGIAPLALIAVLAVAGVAVLALTPLGTPLPSSGAASPQAAEISALRDIGFEEWADGSAVVLDSASSDVLLRSGNGEGGFVRTALRLLVVERRRLGKELTAPFRIARWSTGRLTVEDPAVGTVLELKAYGPTNAAAFAALLDQGRTQP